MRGLVLLIFGIVVAVLACGVLPFVVLPDVGYGAALPVIYVPGEPLSSLGTFPFTDVEVTNTFVAAVVTSLLVFLWVLPVAANLKQVPGRMQAFLEIIIEAWDNLAQSAAGKQGRQIVPLALSIFFFLLVANVMKIVPGVDTIGELHCAGIERGEVGEEGYEYIPFNGYPIHGEPDGIVFLKVEKAEESVVNTGEQIDEHTWHACHDALKGKAAYGEDVYEAGDDHADEEAIAADDIHDETDESGADEEHGEVGGQTGVESAEAEAEHAEEEEDHEVSKADFRYVVTPFIRGASTDLALTLAIAIIAMLVVQYYGIKELGALEYGAKFINIPALNRGGMGYMDFAVGLLETFLEFAKVVSFAFRLFGAMFGGQVLMFVIVFLVAFLVPVIVIGLEVFIGLIQAFVFAILFIMFAAVAMTSHSHDDHDEHHDEHH